MDSNKERQSLFGYYNRVTVIYSIDFSIKFSSFCKHLPCNIFRQYSHLNHFCSHHVCRFGNLETSRALRAREFAHSQLALNYTMRRALHNDAPHSAKLPPDRDARNCRTAGGEAIIVHSRRCCILRTAHRDENRILQSLTKSNFLLNLRKSAISPS